MKMTKEQAINQSVVLSAEIYLDLLDVLIVHFIECKRKQLDAIIVTSALQNAVGGLKSDGAETALAIARQIEQMPDQTFLIHKGNVEGFRSRILSLEMVTGGITREDA